MTEALNGPQAVGTQRQVLRNDCLARCALVRAHAAWGTKGNAPMVKYTISRAIPV